jgi:HK97 family phage prohead protease
MERGFSAIAIKSLDDEQRTIRGVASTVEPDRQLDIVEPLGLRVKGELPLLWQHRHDAPVGTTRFDRPTKAGITFTASLPKVDEPGIFKDQVDHAWAAVRHGAVRFVSIGFLPIEAEPLSTGGTRFKKAELLELSLVSVPANSGATITEVKAIDAAIRSGEVPAPSTSLWDQVKAAGRVGLDRAEQEWADTFEKMLPSERKHAAELCQMQFLQGSIHEMLKFLAGSVEASERRMDQQASAYKGVWQAGKAYPVGSFVTHAGSMWHADKLTDLKPGEGGGWTLAVKRGGQ